MDKALAYEASDSGFDPQYGLFFFSCLSVQCESVFHPSSMRGDARAPLHRLRALPWYHDLVMLSVAGIDAAGRSAGRGGASRISRKPDHPRQWGERSDRVALRGPTRGGPMQ